MSASALRKAARLMRERAEGATPGPWFGNVRFASIVCTNCPAPPSSPTHYVAQVSTVPNGGAHQRVVEGHHSHGNAKERAAFDAEHIASWHPGVALAVALLLDNEANAWDAQEAQEERDGYAPVTANHARRTLLTHLARAYLGDPS